jgi:NAD(P)-dependent dehydrogenase (short-subunit alcohol dehydrogenase family)
MNSHMRLKDKIIAITGAGRGIGLAAARLFASEGAHVAILEIDAESGRAAEKQICADGGRAAWISVDVSDERAVQGAFDRVEREFGGLHVLYNNASIFLRKQDGPIADLCDEVWRRVLTINLSSVFYCSKHAIPLMRRTGGGSIIQTSSSAGLIGIPGCDAYTATKGATIALTRSMAVEYGPFKIRVNCIAPAAIDTPMLRESDLDNPAFDEQAFFRTAPLGRYGSAREVAQVALFLASDESSYLNGAILVADGGITIK